jgi:hypothetical protein
MQQKTRVLFQRQPNDTGKHFEEHAGALWPTYGLQFFEIELGRVFQALVANRQFLSALPEKKRSALREPCQSLVQNRQ